MALNRLVFNTDDAQSILDSANVGAFVRSSDGTLVTKHSLSDSEKAGLISQGLIFKSKIAGAIGNSYSFTVIDSTGSGPLSYTEVSGAIVLDLNGLTPTRAQVVTFLMVTTPSSYVDVVSGTPAGNVIVASIQSFSGGSDSSLHQHLDVYSPMYDAAGNPITSSNGSLNVNVTNTVAISASNLDIRDLVFATDKVDVGGSVVALDSATLVALENISAIVTATDLDIRNLDYSIDNIAIKGATGNQLVVNSDGSINANVDVSIVNGSDKLEDAAAASGDVGTYVLAVRQDTLAASTSLDGDFASFKVSAVGALYVNLAESSATITTSDAALADVAIVAKKETLASVNVAQVASSAPLANRKYLNLYNDGKYIAFIGGSGVDSTDGFPMFPGDVMELRAGFSSAVYFVGETGKTAILRTLQLS
jgi:hypothetical protein